MRYSGRFSTKNTQKLKIVTIDNAEPKECQMCHKIEELRPYGPGGMWVCFECMMKDEAEGKRQFEKLTADANLIVIK